MACTARCRVPRAPSPIWRALAKGEVQLALMQSDVLYHAVARQVAFAGQAPDDQLRSLLRLHIAIS
jgi:TRAP-type uncharacterized transport system substrate-binding protein